MVEPKEMLATLLEEAQEKVAMASGAVVRQIEFPEAKGVIKVAIGMRRAGKTYFLYQTIHKLLASGVHWQQILLINFEDERILPMTAKEMGALLDGFYTLYPENHNRTCYLFLDEVHNVEDWQLVVRRFFDSKNVEMYLTGSSAKLLSKEIATNLRGRSLSVEVWPFNFKEYRLAHNIAEASQPMGQKSFDFMRQHLINFFEKGGFPAVQNMSSIDWHDTLQGYVDVVILRDIIERYGISNISLLKYLTTTSLKNAATPFSLNKFYNDVKSQGYKIGKDTVGAYMSYLEEAFLIFSVPIYTESTRIATTLSKKIYAVDNGLVKANTLGVSGIYSKFLENQVYLDLRRANKDIYYYVTKEGYEIDFVVVDKSGSRELIQVCWDLDNKHTSDREHRALAAAEKELGFSGRIVSLKDYLKLSVENPN